ncbi:DUF1045 domain-containing protein [Mycolicibacterium mengxianglii]|uniref:DUF1045 domain-containing protein n=1 Tax=Mycolicibacterium mengxianglii TaxID=2736649 RepID=UPI0018EEFD9E|nr:DUF1045 domain-containing protein [Mycolicibacterium mengxianglii]
MTRYAVYLIPGIDSGATEPAAALRSAADSWFARAEFQDVTVDARRYGFHATMKAPFRAAAGVSERMITDAVAELAAAHRQVTLRALQPVTIGGFRALVPTGPTENVDALAAEVVRGVDHLRAPLDDADRARRRPDRLSLRQRELLEAWGYPYVLDEFRVHMTLTDRLSAARAPEVDRAIDRHFAEFAGCDIPITSLSVCVEPEPGSAFRPLATHQLRTAATTPAR